MVFDVRGNVLVVRKGAGELDCQGMLKGIVPEDLLTRSVDFVAVVEDSPRVQVEQLPDVQNQAVRTSHLALELG
jgi:hypothetical protein